MVLVYVVVKVNDTVQFKSWYFVWSNGRTRFPKTVGLLMLVNHLFAAAAFVHKTLHYFKKTVEYK